jgi:hypothetical protein
MEMEDGDQSLTRSKTTDFTEMTTESREVCVCGTMFRGDEQFCKQCGTRRPIRTVSQDLCVCGSLLKPEALFCRNCGLTRPEIARRNYNLSVAAKPARSALSVNSMAFSDMDSYDDEGRGSQGTLSTAASVSSFQGAPMKMKTVESMENLSRADILLARAKQLGIDATGRRGGVADDSDDMLATLGRAAGKEDADNEGVATPPDEVQEVRGPALSARSLVKPSRAKRMMKPLLQADRQSEKDAHARVIESMMAGNTSKPQLKAMDDSVVERSRAFLDHDRRAAGLGPLEPRPPDRPQTQRQSRLKPLESPFAEPDLTKWHPEDSRGGTSALPLQALLKKK